MTAITGSVGASGKCLVTGAPVTTTTPAVFKISFQNNTAGTHLSLCAGTNANFNAGQPGLLLSASGGPGYQFLTIVDTGQLSGKNIYVLRTVGTAVAQFTLTID